MRVLGVDPGSVRTGVAVADDELRIALPLRTLTHRGLAQAVRQLAEIVANEHAEQVVIGLPLSLDGRDGDAARKARRFAAELSAYVGATVVMWDERMSSVSAERALRTLGLPGRERRRVVDQAAAALILQSYLDQGREHTWHEDELEKAPAAVAPAKRVRRR